MPADFSDQAVETSAPDFSAQAVPDFSQQSAEHAARPGDADLIAQREAYARSASRWNTLADILGYGQGVAEDATDVPAALNRTFHELNQDAGLIPKNQPATPLELPADWKPELGDAARDAAFKLGYAGTSVPAAAQGAGDYAGDFISQQLTPGNALLLAGGGAPGRAGAAVRALFGAQMAQGIPDAMTQAGNVSVTGDTAAKARAYAGVIVPTVLAGTLAGHEVSAAAPDFSAQSTEAKPMPPKAGPGAAGPSEFGGDVPPPDFSSQAAPPVQTSAPPAAPTGESQAAPPAAPPRPDGDTQTDIGTVPVQRIDAGEIATRPELMQFKRMDDTATGVNQNDKLAGDWDDLKAGNLLLWQPNDPAAYGLVDGQKYIVANGHHRFEFGDRQDVPDYNAQVIKESDGYSPLDARALAAEINIADGKGTIYDATKFLRNSAATYGPDAALARARSIGAQGRQAASIAFEASPDNYTAFVNEQISPDHAEAIAQAAPLSSGPQAEPLQRVGIQAALDGQSPQAIRNLVQAVRLEAGNVAPDQLDLFGADDTAMNAAQQLSKVAGKLQNTLSAEIRSTDAAARNAETAKAKGISFDKDPAEILADNARLKAERARWDNWALHPDLVSQVREYARMGRSGKANASPLAGAAGIKPKSDLASAVESGVSGVTSGHDGQLNAANKASSPHILPDAEQAAERGTESRMVNSKASVAKSGEAVKSGSVESQKRRAIVEQYEKDAAAATDKNKAVVEHTAAEPGEEDSLEHWDVKSPARGNDNSATVFKNEDGTYSVTDEHGNELGYRRDGKNFDAAIAAAKDHVEAGGTQEGYNLSEDARSEIINTVKIPADMILDDVQDTKWGSVYYKITKILSRDEDGEPDETENYKLSIRNHEPSPLREKEFGASDYWVEVPKNAEPKDIAAAVDKIESWIAKRSGEATQVESQGSPPPAPTLEDRLRALKITGTMPTMSTLIPGVDPATFRAVWNTGLDIAIQAVRAGKAIGEAVQAAVDHIKTIFPQGDAEAIRAELQDQLGNGIRQRVATIGAGEASAPVKTAVAADAGYQVRTFEQLKQQARDLVQQRGLDGAFDLYRSNPADMQADTRTALGAELERNFRGEEQRARAQGDTARADLMAQRQVDLWRADAYGTELAQALNARRLFDDSSPQAKLKQAQGLFDEASTQRWQGTQPAAESVRQELVKGNGDAADTLRRDPEVNEAAREAVNQNIADSPETHKAAVMELTETMSQSPAIVAAARELVRERVNEMMNAQAPQRIPAASAHFRAALDDMAKRAASIAAGHYQGAEPNIPLADKFAQRLGLEKSKARKLAQQMDSKFAEMVEQAQKKIPQRIANQRARQAAGLGIDPKDAAVDRSIRQQLQALNQKLGNLVTQHVSTVDAAGRSIADRIIADSGLKGDAADTLRATIQRRWDALATAAKQARLNQLGKSPGGIPGKLRGMLPDLIKLTNLGAFEDAKYFDTVKKKLGLPMMTDDLAREIVRRANALEQIPEGDLRDRAGTQLLNWIVQQRGSHWTDLPMGMYVSNLLSGIKTPVKILFENGTLLASQTLSTLRNPDLMRHPVSFVAKPWAQGQLKGMLQSLEVLRSGIVTGVRKEGARPSSALEQRPFGKYDDWLNIWKYPLRIVAAAHVPLFKPALDLKTTAIAVDVAKREGLTGPALVQRVSDLMGNTENRVAAAKAQAQSELANLGYFKPRQPGETIIGAGRRQAGEQLDYRRRVYEILDQQRNAAVGQSAVDQARDYALHYTYLNEPYGLIGFIAKAVNSALASGQADHPIYAAAVKSQIPFTTVASNIINEHLNWTPIGLGRAALSHYTGELYGAPIADPSARGDLYAKAIAGTVLASGLAAAVAKGWMQINGPGPNTPAGQRQWRDAGNEPWSLTVNGRRYSFQNTPWASSLAVLGAYNDFKQFGKGDEADANTRLGFAMKAVASQALSVPMLTGVHDLVEAVNPNNAEGDTGNKLEKLLARTGGKFIAPQWLKDVDQAFDPMVHDQTGIKALLASQVPFVRRETQPVLNRLGEPVQRGLFSAWSGPATQDPVWRTIVDKTAWIPEPDRNHIVGNKALGPDYYRTITPDELYDVVKETGPRIRARLEAAIDLPQMIGDKMYRPLPDLEPADAKELVRKITEEEERTAYSRLR